MNELHGVMLKAAMQIEEDLESDDRYAVAVLVWIHDDGLVRQGHVISNVDTTSLIKLLRNEADKMEQHAAGADVAGHA